MHAEIEVKGLSKNFGKKQALDRITLSMKKGISIVLGANGAGKSTLLRCIDGLYRPDSGSVKVLDTDPYIDQQLKSRLSLLADSYGLYDFLTVKANLEFFGKLHGFNSKEAVSSQMENLEAFDATQYMDYKVGELSRGTKQKIAFCRAVMNDPEVLLLDEPTAFLDTRSSEYIREYLVRNEKKKSIVLVTQKIDEVTRFNSRIIVIRNGKVVSDSGAGAFYRAMLRNIEINIRLAKPISMYSARKITGFVRGNAEKPNLIRVMIKDYKGVNRCIRELIDSGASVVSVDYIEPAIEKLAFGEDDD